MALKILDGFGRRLNRFFSFNGSPIRWPWIRYRDPANPAHALRALIFDFHRRRQRPAKLVAEGLLWWPKSAGMALVKLRSHGKPIRDRYGVSRWRQWRDMVALACAYNLLPDSYYFYRLYEPRNFARAESYLESKHMHVLFEILYGKDANPAINDKERFLRHCRQAGLPTPPLAALLRGEGGETWVGTPGALPARDLFLKYIRSSGGKGAERWNYDAASRTYRRGEQALGEAELLHHCRRKAQGQPVMVQHAVDNHPAVAAWGRGALCTARFITFRLRGDRPKPLAAAVRMPLGAMEVDNISSGGIAARADLRTGVLGEAIGRRLTEKVDRHPDTGAPIAGRAFPRWDEVVRLALRSHESFGEPWAVGWDIAMTPEGPVLLEGNTHYGFDLLQVALGAPLGETDYPRLFLEALHESRRNGSDA